MSKLVGERYATHAPRHYVLRLSSVYGGHTRRTTTDWFIERARAGQPVPAFRDRTVSPSYVPVVVDATLRLLAKDAPQGLYHAVSTGSCTWADIASKVLQWIGRPDLLQPTRFQPDAHRAPRPKNCALANGKLAGVIGAIPEWGASLDDYLSTVSPGSGR